MQKEFSEGYIAYQEGKSEWSNPYAEGTRENDLWSDGFFTAMEDVTWSEV